MLFIGREVGGMELVNDLDLASPDGQGINCMQWVSVPGPGILYGTNNGQILHIS